MTLCGTNDFARKAELGQLIDVFVAEQGDFGLERIDGSEVELGRLLETVASLPFLANKRMVVLDQPGSNKAIAESISKVIDATADTTELIIVEPKPDKRSTYYKTLKKSTEFKEFAELDERGLTNWLVAEAKRSGGILKPADALYLAQRVGANQLLLANELQKLLEYDPTISRATIDLLTDLAPQSSVFELIDAALLGNRKKVVSIYEEQRKQKVEPQAILGMIAWQLHVLAVVKTAGQRPVDEISRTAKLNPFVVRKSMNVTRNLTVQRLKLLVHDALELDIRLKSESINADDAVQYFLLAFV